MGLMAVFTKTRRVMIGIGLVFLILVTKCVQTKTYSYKEAAVPEPIPLSPRLENLFSKKKLVCFGRYALEVPAEAELDMGTISMPSPVDTIDGGMEAIPRDIAAKIAKTKAEDETAEFTYNGVGPAEGSWQLHYSGGQFLRDRGLFFFRTYVNRGELTFIFGDGIRRGETEREPLARQASIAKTLRLRDETDIPAAPGFCLEHAFVPRELYAQQEIVDAGIHLPSIPDVSFSVSSNKNAYGDYPAEEFEQRLRGELSLLARIKGAQKDQGLFYPKRNVLREGKRNLNHWRGEESLFVRPDGTHDFEWAFVGTPGDVANPSEFSVRMHTKVAYNTVGAAKAASLNDEEAVALWDKLLTGLKFRVKVPGSPKGSYFLEPKK